MWWKSLASIARAGYRPHDSLSQAEEVSGGGNLDASIHLIAIGIEPPDFDLLGSLAADLARTFEVSCHIEEECLNPLFAFNADRAQYYSTAILEKLAGIPAPPLSRIIGVSSVDLYVPILTFVFGEAQLSGNRAVVSHYRLAEPGRPDMLRERLAKEAVHELGHTFGLRHCENWNCVMSSSHSVERLDIKSARFCSRCRRVVSASYQL